MRTVVTSILIIILALSSTQQVNASTALDVLTKYGISVNKTEEEVKKELTTESKLYAEMYSQFIQTMDVPLILKIAKENLTRLQTRYNIIYLENELEYLQEYLRSLISKDAPVTTLLETSVEYDTLHERYVEALSMEEAVKSRQSSVNYFENIVETTITIEDLKAKEYIVNKLKRDLTTVVTQGDIGNSKAPYVLKGTMQVLSKYGYRVDPVNRNKRQIHNGLDLKAKSGDRVTAAYGGKIIFVGEKGDWGNIILVDHGNGLSTLYGHLSKMYVKVGDKVTQNQSIGETGMSGSVTIEQLHFGVYINGKPVNPQVVFE